MSIITTTYTERLTITTDDAGNVTTSRTHSARTVTEYLFCELAPEAQERAIRNAIEEEADAYHTSSLEYASHTGTDIAEVWDAYRELQKHQPLEWHDHYWSFYLTVGDAERITTEKDTGICWSMDICDAWNAYARAIEMLIEEAEDHEATADQITAPYYWPYCITDEVPGSALIWSTAHGNHADACRHKADELAEQAKDAVESVIKSTIDDLETYYQSPEFWREWLEESDDRYSRDGARI